MRSAPSWQLILADLAMILFVCSLAGMAGARDAGSVAQAQACEVPLASSHALYSASPGAAPFGLWLSEQSGDPAARLTIFGFYQPGEQGRVVSDALKLEKQAREAGVAVRMVLEAASESQVMAGLAYDQMQPGTNPCDRSAASGD